MTLQSSIVFVHLAANETKTASLAQPPERADVLLRVLAHQKVQYPTFEVLTNAADIYFGFGNLAV